MHETAEAAKAIISAYYGKAPAHSYFSGCSDGGREALMEAQRFPTDYDGIVAGAPANSWTNLLTAVGDEQAIAQPDAWLPPEKLALVTKAVLACPARTASSPIPANAVRPVEPRCKAGETNDCLTEAQAQP